MENMRNFVAYCDDICYNTRYSKRTMGFDTHLGGRNMNKKLGKTFWPGLWVYFTAMALFVIGAVLFRNYTLAAIEAAVAVAVGAFYIFCRVRRI